MRFGELESSKDMSAEKLTYLNQHKIRGCTRCRLAKSRNKVVPGDGHREAELVLVGEAPGANEDTQGKPFVGVSGKLLNAMLRQIRLKRHEVFVTNILKCRPPDNRDPYTDEIETCTPWLHAQLWLLKPRVIVTLGRFAGNHLTGTTDSMGSLRQRDWTYRNDKTATEAPVVCLYHPSYLGRLRNDDPDEAKDKYLRCLLDLRRAGRMAGILDGRGQRCRTL